MRITLLQKIMGAAFLFGLGISMPTLSEDFGHRTPTPDEIIQSLDPPKTRGIRPGAALKSMARPSISMELQFDFNSAKIADAEEERMNVVAEALKAKRLTNMTFDVIGHTDAKGSDQYNKKLSEQRASSVVAFLVKHGIDKSRLNIIGKGKTELKNKDDPEAAENRRVEIAVSK